MERLQQLCKSHTSLQNLHLSSPLMQEIITTYYFKGEKKIKERYIQIFKKKSPVGKFYVLRFSDIKVLPYKQAIQLCLVLVCV